MQSAIPSKFAITLGLHVDIFSSYAVESFSTQLYLCLRLSDCMHGSPVTVQCFINKQRKKNPEECLNRKQKWNPASFRPTREGKSTGKLYTLLQQCFIFNKRCDAQLHHEERIATSRGSVPWCSHCALGCSVISVRLFGSKLQRSHLHRHYTREEPEATALHITGRHLVMQCFQHGSALPNRGDLHDQIVSQKIIFECKSRVIVIFRCDGLFKKIMSNSYSNLFKLFILYN